ncbi:DNA sulfur modification protein DndD [Variovorax sp. 1140]|uniref:DNA sulfur modification protein DndD n=1 Tax=Variovorax atrisoli TaxID=3394203 RepID=UPI00339B624A
MLLETLVLGDVGTFRGEQVLDLRPKTRAGKNRPVVLFGGLNGAGKTTILNSIRHVLYGRQALDVSVTQKGYEEILRGMIHNPPGQLIKPDQAYIELHFTYSRLGKKVRYKVIRSWIDRGSSVDETLTLTQNDEPKPLLTGDGAQAFLSQLIPAGVSQFFFFDGEKIAALARDDSDEVLADAIRRLLGLDMADRLRSDLGVFLRARKAATAMGEARKELEQLYAEIEAEKTAIGRAEADLQGPLTAELTAAKQGLERRKVALTEQGGAWAANRKSLEQRLDELSTQRVDLEERVREDLSGISIFALAPRLSSKLLEQAKAEHRQDEHRIAVKAVRRQADQLKALLSKALAKSGDSRALADACVDKWLGGIDRGVEKKFKPLHHFTASDFDRLDDSLRKQLPIALGTLRTIGQKLNSTATESIRVQDELAHAPTEESVEGAFSEYQLATRMVAELEMRNRMHVEGLRLRISNLINLIRKSKKLEDALEQSGVSANAEGLASRVQDMIADYKVAAAEAKCKTLERHFVTAFRRLARKEDIVDHAIIDASSFSVTLVDRHGRETPKKRLSAGEKQIFAIAMLEALAKTSGRNLPIIIDTPLGRLDSKHRAKLVESYFPFASHQVLVLSTDTEVDQAFYTGMRPSISHAFHLQFDETEGFTSVSQGYFWNHLELAHAA